MPGQNGELSGDGDPGHVYPLFARDTQKLMSQRSWVPAGMMGALDQQPAHVAVALFRDLAVVGPFGTLVHAGNEAEVAGELQRTLEPLDIADRSHHALSGRGPYAWKGHQQLHTVAPIGIGVDQLCDLRLLLSHGIQGAQERVDFSAVSRRQRQVPQPLSAL